MLSTSRPSAVVLAQQGWLHPRRLMASAQVLQSGTRQSRRAKRNRLSTRPWLLRQSRVEQTLDAPAELDGLREEPLELVALCEAEATAVCEAIVSALPAG